MFKWIYDNQENLLIGGDYDKYAKTKEDIGALNNQPKFYDILHSKGFINVLCNTFQKVVKNAKKNVKKGEEDRYNNDTNTIKCRYMVKTIKLNEF